MSGMSEQVPPVADTTTARKVRWTVPAPDLSVKAWLDAQSNLSESLRLLVRDRIERDGYIDVAYRPIRQLPRRGRPPATVEREEREEQQPSPPPQARAARVDLVHTGPAARDHSDQVDQDSEDEQTGPEVVPATTPAPAPEPDKLVTKPAKSGGMVDMDDIFGHHG